MWEEDQDWTDDEEAAEAAEGGDGFDTEFYNGKKNVAVILIDVGADMFDSGAFLRCVNALIQIIEGILLKSYRNSICVGFIGDTIGPLIEFHTNIVDAIKYLKSYCGMSAADLKAQNERKQPVQMRYVLTECMKLFERLDKINPHVVLLTSDDEPHKGAPPSEDLAAYNIASAFRSMNTKLIVLPLCKQFRMDKFYLKLMKTANDIEDDDVGVVEDVYLTEESLIEILTRIIKHDSKPHRHLFRLYHSDDVKPFWIQMRYFVEKTHLYKNLRKSRITGNKVVKQFRPGSLVDRSQLMLQKQGSKSVRVAKSAKLNQSQKAGFQLLYVSKTNQARKHFQNKRGFLLQNDDIGNEPADLTFQYFWEFCSNPDSPRYPICSFSTSGNRQHPKLVQLTADTFHSKPCFLGAFLPSLDQIQRFPQQYQKFEEPVPQAAVDPDDPKLGLVCDMIDKLTIKFNPNLYKDPNYEKKAVVLKAKLQNEPLHQLVYKNTLPTPEEVTESLGATSEYLKAILNKKNTGPARKKCRKN